MRALSLVSFVVVAVALSGAAVADEVIHFRNGTSMAVIKHVFKDGFIHVDLGSGEMAFPASQVERIERDDEIVVSAVTGQANRRVEGPVKAYKPRAQWQGEAPAASRPKIEMVNGVATVPMHATGSPAQRKLRLTGRREIWEAPPVTRAEDGRIGTVPVGNRQIIARPGAVTKRPEPVGIEQRPTTDSDSASKKR